MPLLDLGIVPDPLIRFGIRRICARRLSETRRLGEGAKGAHVLALRQSPIAADVGTANLQHYEVPAAFFEQVLGPRLKYSCCTWGDGAHSLENAETHSLAQVFDRAQLANGQRILELGCGWGSLTLYMAARLPGARITAVSNSRGQRAFIEARAAAMGLANVDVITADVTQLELEGPFDRVVSIEMFEHMRNWEELLARIGGWLRPDGKLFIHIFAHREFAYLYEDQGPSDWMARHFFTGGQMPSEDLLDHFNRDMRVTERWHLSGRDYARTANAWLDNLDENRDQVLAALGTVDDAPDRAMHRWRIFFMACAELFAFRNGNEWGVYHYLLEKRVE
ncbi:MAG: cyclopropane-fatty-acyl-phospholipid synthase family protein [Myxococcota bacterium]